MSLASLLMLRLSHPMNAAATTARMPQIASVMSNPSIHHSTGRSRHPSRSPTHRRKPVGGRI